MQFLITITQIALLILCALGMLSIYAVGARDGAKAAAMLELFDRFPDMRPERPLTALERELREEYIARAHETLFQKWRVAYNLPDNADTRELFRDADYRKSLQEQNKP